MNEPAESNAIETTLASVLSTAELSKRPSRPPDYAGEIRALQAIVQQMADSPQTVLQKLVDVALEICRAGSAGVSLLDNEGHSFDWPAIAGAWKPHMGGGTPRDFGPSGIVLDRNAVQLFTHPERYYRYLTAVQPSITEALVTPFYVDGKPVGTVWVISHDETRFDGEDVRLMINLGRVAAAIYTLRAALEARVQESESLLAINEALVVSSVHQHELTERAEKAEAAARESEEHLVVELDATRRLQATSTQLIPEGKPEALYGQILEGAIGIMRSDMASMQILDEREDVLRLVSFRGFDSEFGRIFALVGPGSRTSCRVAWGRGHRVVVPDVETCDFIVATPALEDHRRTGIRAAQSTPLISRTGRLLGMISTHWRKPHHPPEQNLHLIDVLARQAADLIERTQAEKALSESEERLRALVSVLTDIPWTADAEGRFTSPQPAWTAFTGQTGEELSGFGWLNAIHPEDRAEVRGLWERASRNHEMYRSHGRIWHRDSGRYRHFQARATPLFSQDKAVRGWVGASTDVEEQERFEAALQNLNTDLKHFSYAAAHDLQEPLRTVLSSAQLLARNYKDRLDPSADQLIYFVMDGAQRLQLLLAGLQEYWSVNEERIEKLLPVDCNHVLQQAIIQLEVSIRESGAIVTQGSLPTVIAETVPLTLVFQNLISNAMKYRLTDAPPRIHVAAERIGETWRISVKDNGIGIPANYLEEIFAPFKRLHGREYPGTGLGLAMCRKIVERYQGRIWVESTYGDGSTFYFTLPAQAHDEGKAVSGLA